MDILSEISLHGFQNNFFDTASLSQSQRCSGSNDSTQRSTFTTDFETSRKRKDRRHSNIFSLGDFVAVDALSTLVDVYGRASHMGILDDSYRFFVTRALDGAISFKVKDHICLVGGDLLCSEELYPEVLRQFAEYRRRHSWGIVFVGASDTFAYYAKRNHWTTIQFGSERVLNPLTNPVLSGKKTKRIASQIRQLLNPSKGGITIGVYNPSVAKDVDLQQRLVAVYDAWREARNRTRGPQAFITVYNLFAITGPMIYIYTLDPNGTPNGFAALRRIGANNGFHVDPFIAAPSAPRGISDLLIFSSMAFLNAAGCKYLSFGYEPLAQSGEIFGMPIWMQCMTRKIHNYIFDELGISGKKAYHDKWYPDEEQSTNLHLIFPSGVPGIQDFTAVLHFSNISLRSVVCAKMKKMVLKKETAPVTKDKAEQATEKGDVEEVNQMHRDNRARSQMVNCTLSKETIAKKKNKVRQVTTKMNTEMNSTERCNTAKTAGENAPKDQGAARSGKKNKGSDREARRNGTIESSIIGRNVEEMADEVPEEDQRTGKVEDSSASLSGNSRTVIPTQQPFSSQIRQDQAS